MFNDEISIAEGATFVVSDNVGNIMPSNGHGFFRSDTRFLSAFVVTLNGVSTQTAFVGKHRPSHREVLLNKRRDERRRGGMPRSAQKAAH